RPVSCRRARRRRRPRRRRPRLRLTPPPPTELPMARIFAYTAHAAGHMFPLVPGLLALRERGHDVYVRTQAELVDAVRAAGLAADAIDPAILDVPVRDYEVRRDIDRLRRGVHDMISRGPLESADLQRAIAATRADVLLIDVNTFG